jgi:hypothetical protein
MKHEQAQRLVPAIPPRPANFAGHWENELQSTMELRISGNAVTGTYTSNVSGGGGPIAGAIIGVVSGHIISFIVDWPTPSITSWIGHLVKEDGVDVIETLWHLATPTENPDDPNELWASIYAGADRFHR